MIYRKRAGYVLDYLAKESTDHNYAIPRFFEFKKGRKVIKAQLKKKEIIYVMTALKNKMRKKRLFKKKQVERKIKKMSGKMIKERKLRGKELARKIKLVKKTKLAKMKKEDEEVKKEDEEVKKEDVKMAIGKDFVDNKFYSGYVPFEKFTQDLVHIKAGHDAVMLRIEHLMAHKREYCNETNIREFCSSTHKMKGQGCARTDSIVVKRTDGKSHIEVYRVFNKWGPQTRGIDPGSINHPDPPDPLAQMIRDREAALKEPVCDQCGSSTMVECPFSVIERLDCAEVHLKLESSVPRDVYQRLKTLEDRILQMEAISPEYAILKNVANKYKDYQPMDFTPLCKRSYSKYDLKRRLAMLQNELYSKYGVNSYMHKLKVHTKVSEQVKEEIKLEENVLEKKNSEKKKNKKGKTSSVETDEEETDDDYTD